MTVSPGWPIPGSPGPYDPGKADRQVTQWRWPDSPKMKTMQLSIVVVADGTQLECVGVHENHMDAVAQSELLGRFCRPEVTIHVLSGKLEVKA